MELTLRIRAGSGAWAALNDSRPEQCTEPCDAQAVQIVWHDTPEGFLASRGLTVTEESGKWRLERFRPAKHETWPPGTHHRIMEEADAQDAIGHEADGPLIGRAVFAGQRMRFVLTMDDKPVKLTLLHGVLRNGGPEEHSETQPVARITLDGPPATVLTLASALAETLPLSLPPHGLTEEALRLTIGINPALPHVTDKLPSIEGLPVNVAFARIMGHLTNIILALAPVVADPASGPEPVHQMRVAVRRARSALSLFPRETKEQPGEQATPRTLAAAGLKKLGRALGPARDLDVFMTETAPPVAAAFPGELGLTALLLTGEARRQDARTALAAWVLGPEFQRLGLALTCLANAEPGDSGFLSLTETAAAQLRSRWKKLRRSAKSLAKLDSPGLHKVRLRAKRLRYAAEFFAPLFPGKPASRFIRRLSVLQARLGVFNDTAVADGLLRDLDPRPNHAAGLILGFTAARGQDIRPKIATAWARLRGQPAFWM